MAEHEASLTDTRIAKRMELCGAEVTLDGKRAKIAGYRNPFAHVTQMDTGYSVEYSWETVERIIKNGGAFRG